MAFGIIIDVTDDEDLLEGMMLPAIFRNHIPNAALNLRLKNHRRRTFVVPVGRLPNGRLFLHGAQWRAFIQSNEYANIVKMCFIWKRLNSFQVSFIDNEGLETSFHRRTGEYVRSCLITATSESVVKQELPKALLSDFSYGRYYRSDNLVATIKGPKQNSTVHVYYVYDQNEEVGEAQGFVGSNWQNFCTQNDIEEGHTLMFINERNMKFTVKVFNNDGIEMQMQASSVDEGSEDANDHGGDLDNEEEDPVLASKHICSLLEHEHNVDLPRYYKKVEPFSVHLGILTVPTYFVKTFELFNFGSARLKFGVLSYNVNLEVHPDPRRPGNRNHIVMQTNWRNILQETGLTEGKILRFQLNLHEYLEGKLLEFEVC